MPRNSLLKTSLTTLGALALVGATFTGTAFATGSHGAHTDRSVEHGGSGTQGRSSSDPDGMSNGGADKPGGSGGYDKTDQDGNNGCGNDADFEDDNNGNCGGTSHDKAEVAKPAKAEHGTTCTCDTSAAEKAKAEKAKAEKAKAEKAKAEKAKAEKAKAEKASAASCNQTGQFEGQHEDRCGTDQAKGEHKTEAAKADTHQVCDRRTDERDQRAATAEVRVAKHGDVKAEKDDHQGEVVAAPVTTSTTSTTSTTAPAGVLSSELVAPPAAVAAPAPSSFGSAAAAESPAPAGVLSAEAVAPEVQAASVSTGSSGGVVGALSSALAFTGLNLATFLLVALLTIALGWFLVRADRKRHA